MEAKDLVHGWNLRELVFLEEGLNIKYFENGAVCSNCKERSWRWELTCSDSFVVWDGCKFVDLFGFVKVSSEVMMWECEVLMLSVQLIVVDYTVGLFEVLNVLSWGLILNLFLFEVHWRPSAVVLLELKVLFADWFSDFFLGFCRQLSRTAW